MGVNMQSTEPLKATTVIVVLVALLAGTTGLLMITGTAFGCEGVAAETELTNETTHEKHAHFAPVIGRNEEFEDTFTWDEEVTVKGSKLDVIQGGVWEELAQCPSRTYKRGESCDVWFLIDCAGGENVIAEQLIDIGFGEARESYEGECL
jgi:hypothetical protein